MVSGIATAVGGTAISGAIFATVGIPALVAGWGWVDQSCTIWRVGLNTANEQEMQLFEHGLKDDTDFRRLTFQWQRLFGCCCCGRSKYKTAARRLRIATRRVVEERLQLPPFGSPLIENDNSPKGAHTPIGLRDHYEQQSLLEHPEFQRSPLIQRLRLEHNMGEYVAPQNVAAADHGRVSSRESIPRSDPTAHRPRISELDSIASVPLSTAGRLSRMNRAPGVPTPPGGDQGPGGPDRGVISARSPAGGDVSEHRTPRSESGGIFSRLRERITGGNPTDLNRTGPSGTPAGASGGEASPLLEEGAGGNPGGWVQGDPITSAGNWAGQSGPYSPNGSGERPMGPELEMEEILHRRHSLVIDPAEKIAKQGRSLGTTSSATPPPESAGLTRDSPGKSAFDEAGQRSSSSFELRGMDRHHVSYSASDLLGWANFGSGHHHSQKVQFSDTTGSRSGSVYSAEARTSTATATTGEEEVTEPLLGLPLKSRQREPTLTAKEGRGAMSAQTSARHARGSTIEMVEVSAANRRVQRQVGEVDAQKRAATQKGASGAAIPGRAIRSGESQSLLGRASGTRSGDGAGSSSSQGGHQSGSGSLSQSGSGVGDTSRRGSGSQDGGRTKAAMSPRQGERQGLGSPSRSTVRMHVERASEGGSEGGSSGGSLETVRSVLRTTTATGRNLREEPAGRPGERAGSVQSSASSVASTSRTSDLGRQSTDSSPATSEYLSISNGPTAPTTQSMTR